MESTDDPYPSCDRCSSSLCKSCAKLTTTEMRAVTMRKRSVIFLCPECRPLWETLVDLAAFKDALLHQMRQESAALIGSIEASVVAKIMNKIGSVSDEMSALKQSSDDLVGLLTNGPFSAVTAEHLKVSHGGSGAGGNQEEEAVRLASEGEGTTSPPSRSAPASKPSAFNIPAMNVSDRTAACSSRPSPSAPVAANAPVAKNTSSSSRGFLGRARPSVVVGSRRVENSRLTAANIPKKTSIFVSRLDKRVTPEDLLDYLHSTFGVAETFSIEEQKVRSQDYRSYRVEAKAELLDQLLCASNWPENVPVKKFRFPRPSQPVSK